VENLPRAAAGQAADGVFDAGEVDEEVPAEEPFEVAADDEDLAESAELVPESLLSFLVVEPLLPDSLPPDSLPDDSEGVLRESVR
jgi:hypothetical protein